MGVVLIIIGDYGTAWTTEMDVLAVDWLFWSQVWFYAAGLSWLFVLVLIQVLHARQARNFPKSRRIPSAY